jgi:hypothetical protein
MKRGPASGRTRTDFVARARDSWGEVPDHILVLAEEATRTSAAAAAARIGYSAAVISDVIGNKYRGDMARVAESIRGALMGAVVACPVLGEIGRDRCLQEQKRPYSPTSSLRARLYRACRSGCPHARHMGEE